eukprot:CAMPEP_0114986746 /NCGR_PEP_ID=MMETSP0216-20121206/8599_1 /TAXON_ID=223996 /ORGANISM="Protocruzia adherens, Strain Boccale" /LENGTH=355 /DNA_ID=CAMNT_0002349219 /DNA_START=37 /DNA_END=1104 /DNA_ORIENTATION=+
MEETIRDLSNQNETETKSPHKITQPQLSTYKLHHRYTVGEGTAEVFVVKFDNEDKLLAAGCGDGSIKIYNAYLGKTTHVLLHNHYSSETRMPCTGIMWRPPGASAKTKNVLIASYSDGSLCHWHATSGKCLHTIHEETNQIYCVDYARDGQSFATAGKDRTVRVYDEATKQVKAEMTRGNANNPGHSNRIFSVKFHPQDSNVVFSGGWDDTIQIFDVREEGPVRSFFGPHMCGDSMDIFEDTVLCGSWRPKDQLELFDFGSGQKIQSIEWTSGSIYSNSECYIYSAQFHPSGELLAAGGSGTNEVKIFDRETQRAICTISDLPRACLSLNFSKGGSMLAIGSGDGCLRCMNVIKG